MESNKPYFPPVANLIQVPFKWRGKEFNIQNMVQNSLVKEMKDEICKLTGVDPVNQKLFFKGKILQDDQPLDSFSGTVFHPHSCQL